MASTQTKEKYKKPVVCEKNKSEESILMTMAEEKEKKKKPGNEIDEIFQGKKAKKPKEPNESKEGKPSGTSELKKKAKEKKGAREEGNSNNKRNKKRGVTVVEEGPGDKAKRRRTAEGLAIYTEEELGIGNRDAGGTPLCPFDCSCCF